jgi:hypothetical protein
MIFTRVLKHISATNQQANHQALRDQTKRKAVYAHITNHQSVEESVLSRLERLFYWPLSDTLAERPSCEEMRVTLSDLYWMLRSQ